MIASGNAGPFYVRSGKNFVVNELWPQLMGKIFVKQKLHREAACLGISDFASSSTLSAS
jgi:hypothetical protein